MSHLSAIGFGAPDLVAFDALVDRTLQDAVEPGELGAEGRRHRWVRDESGAAMAAHLEGDAIECLTPFFRPEDGGTRWRVRTHSPHLDQDCRHCSGADCDILGDDPADEMLTRATVQWLYFDAWADRLREERTLDLRVVGFASRLYVADDDARWEAAQTELFGPANPDEAPRPGHPMRLADQAMLPYGMFGNEGDVGSRARALVTGRVQVARRLTNGITGQRFLWLRVETLGGPLDLVSPDDPACLLEPGTRALAEVWLVGDPLGSP